MAAAPPPELTDDLIGEILLRLPPDEPEHLFRAALVCKAWLSVLREPAFLRHYRAFHRTPPLLGLFHRFLVRRGEPGSRFVPATAAPIPPYPDWPRSRALDSRHGRVLLQVGGVGWRFVVWDPVTGDQHHLPDGHIPRMIYSAAVLCIRAACDHLDCHGGPFRVVVIVPRYEAGIFVKAFVYSSGTRAWSMPDEDDSESSLHRRRDAIAKTLHFTTNVQSNRGAVTGDGFYFTMGWCEAVLKYDWGNNCFSVIAPPSRGVNYRNIALMVTEDFSLGYACTRGSRVYFWTRKLNSERPAEWVQRRVIELKTIIPVANFDDEPSLVGFAEGVDVIFVSTDVGLFRIELKSGCIMKVGEPGNYCGVLPYMSFYTPGSGRLLQHKDSLISDLMLNNHTLQNGHIKSADVGLFRSKKL